MKKNLLFIAIILVTLASCVKDRTAPAVGPVVTPTGDTLMYYWNFNNADSTIHTPDFSKTGANAYFSYVAAYIDYTSGSSINLIGPIADTGSCLRLRNPSQSLTFHMPTTGYDSLVMSMAVEASSSGASIDDVYYTVDGTNYINTGLATPAYNVTTSFTQVTIDFSSIPATGNNPNFAVKLVPANNSAGTATSGNDRFDNVTLSGVKQ